MASKRVMYKPATKEKISTREKRKPLAQGRLVTKATGGESGAKTSVLKQGTINNEPVSTSSYPKSLQRARVALTSSPTTSPARQRREEDSPRREMPHASMTRSPRRAEPLRTLDLSDMENDTSEASKAALDASIIMVDASRQTLGPDTSEVDISFGHAQSPAKVICHAPSVVHSRLRNTGDVKEARKVTVDHVPSMNVISYSDYTDPGAPRPVPTFKSPVVVRESTIAGSPADLHSTAKPTVNKNLFTASIEESKHTGSAVQYPQPHDMLVDNVSEASDGSASDTASEMSDRQVMKILSESAADDQKKKRKGAHYPTSRYLHTSTTAAKAKSKGPLKATDRGIMGSTSISGDLKSKRTGDLGPKRTGDLKPKKAGNTSKYRVPVAEPKHSSSLKPKSSGGTAVTRTTPQRSGSAQKSAAGKRSKMTTSTPTGVDGQQSAGAEISWQAPRHLTPDVSMDLSRRVPKDISLDLHRHGDSHHDSKMSSLSTTVSTIGSNDSRQLKTSGEVNQLQLDMMYARYLQAVYLESKARKSFKEQEKNVMAELYGMAELVTEKRKRKDELEQQVSKLRHMNEVDDALHLQENGLGPVVLGLEKLSRQYNTLSEALDTTRHQLPTRGVYIPDNMDNFIDHLQSVLNESEQLLGELSVMCRQKHPNVTTFAEALRTLDHTANEQASELAKCQQSLAAATALTVQQSSLRIQDLQLVNA